MHEFELNIGLMVGTNEESPHNSWSAISHRANQIESRLRSQIGGRIRRHWGEEPTLVVSSQANNVENLRVFVEQLSEEFDQDCIALYFPHTGNGYLLGPNAAAWGDFDPGYFVRYYA